MKVIIAGSRSITDYAIVEQAVKESGFEITEVICGCADGVDVSGWHWARQNNIKVEFCPAWYHQWKWARRHALTSETVHNHFGEHGKIAGYARNRLMAHYAEALVAVQLNDSKGTQNMIDMATKRGLKVFVKRL